MKKQTHQKKVFIIPRPDEDNEHRTMLRLHGINTKHIVLCNAGSAHEPERTLRQLRPQSVFVYREGFELKQNEIFSSILTDIQRCTKGKSEVYVYGEWIRLNRLPKTGYTYLSLSKIRELVNPPTVQKRLALKVSNLWKRFSETA